MKTIQWFPGHMAKTMRQMEGDVSLTDGIIYVLDARCPASTFNKKLLKIAGGKPVLYVLNKGDLADGKSDALLKLAGDFAVKVNAVNQSSKKDILRAMENIISAKREKNAAKGYNKTYKFMVVGVPNTGKSTVINLLAASKRAATGDKAGVTRGKQWVRLGDFELLDTPGTMPPAIENERFARRLAYIGSVNDDILDFDEIAAELLKELYEKYPSRLEERYGISSGECLDMFDCVCKRRGFVSKGGEYDYSRASRAVVDDFRKGKLGKITLDSEEDMRESFGK